MRLPTRSIEKAVERAVERGVNVIDTAINYRNQAERARGGRAALAAAIRRGAVQRDEDRRRPDGAATWPSTAQRAVPIRASTS